jgi:hypothetical protein
MIDDTKLMLVLLFTGAVAAGGIGITINQASKERDIEKAKCLKVGGTYTPQYRVPAICFAPGVILKGEMK